MKSLLAQLHCIWFGHSYKLIWEDEGEYATMWDSPLKKMKCTNCGREVIVKKT